MPSVSSTASSRQSNEGRFDTLTPDQQERLKQMWSVLLAAMEIAEPQAPAASPTFDPKPLVPKLLGDMTSRRSVWFCGTCRAP